MAKIYGLFGSMKGKVADVVMAVRNGEQIVRKYQPIVSNPKTEAQVATRAKLKLLSQLSTVMAPVIAIRRQGPMSSRNLFTKSNYKLTSYAGNIANIELTSVQLTKSVVALPNVSATRSGSAVNVELSAPMNIDRIVYAFFSKQSDNTLRFVDSKVVTDPGTNKTFAAEITVGSANAIVYAYGVRDNTETARVTFGNMQVVTAETVAKVITSRVLLESDVTLTETRATEVAAS